MKLVPVTVRINAALPAVALVGDNAVNAGSGLFGVIVKVCAVLVPPPGNGVKTVTATVPAEMILVAGTTAVNCVGLIKVVTRAAPFQLITEPLIKSVPVTVNVNAVLPAIVVFGLIAVSTGGGLLTIMLLIVKSSEPLVPPPGAPENTVIFAVPAVAIFAAGMDAVNCVELP